MKKLISVIVGIIVFTTVLVVGVTHVLAESSIPSETNAFVSSYYLEPIDQKAPFFDVVLPKIAANIKENNKHSITPYFDKLPLANNPTNFQSLGATTYANINGQTVTAEAFYRVPDDSLYDPNCGLGLLVYQCIQYKRAHPEEDVKLSFSSMRTSVTASVCVLPESKYYGYMRSLYGTNYDEHGFVRISYMLTEAARMGIEVTIITQRNAYGVKQYNPATGQLKSRANLDHDTYFTSALKSDCYDSYAPGKKVSDFMKYAKVDWQVDDKNIDEVHVKHVSASHYLATDGTEHKNAVFFSGANLDENNYFGGNGNGKSQSGLIVSDHADLYRVTCNYVQLMYKYRHQEGIYELRDLANKRNTEQIALIKSGKGHLIPEDEQIVYMGTENDPVFEMYFTSLGGSMDNWDTVNNPISKYIDKLPQSEDYVELTWNAYHFNVCYMRTMCEKMITEAFCENPNAKNKIALRIADFPGDAINKLKLGTEIGYCSIKDSTKIHSKDILVSYQENGERHRVSLMMSASFGPDGLYYRTNSLMVINETDATGGNFYNIFGKKYSYGMLDEGLNVSPGNVTLTEGQTLALDVFYTGKGTLTYKSGDSSVVSVENGILYARKPGVTVITVSDGNLESVVVVSVTACSKCAKADAGLTCSINDQYVLSNRLPSTPLTFEAVFSVNKKDLKTTNSLLSSDGAYNPALAFTINQSGQPQVMIRQNATTKKAPTYVFDKVDVATGKTVHLSVVMDFSNKKLHCYINGNLAQTISNISSFSSFKEKWNYVIGGDHLNGNATYFPGVIEQIAVWSDMRSANEIASDYSKGISYSDANLMAAYNLTLCDSCMVKDLSRNNVDLDHSILWQSKSSVTTPTDYAYSFAVVGDTQKMCETDPEAMEGIYDWILKNQKSKKIAYVIGLGDITDDSTDREWVDANKYISKLNNKIPYSLCRGNHDDWDDFNRILHNGYYETTVDGMMVSGDVELTDPKQPGLVEKTVDGVKGIYTRQNDIPEGGTVKGDLTNSYKYLSVSGTDYLIITLDFAPNEKMLKWVDSVLEAHPKHKAIIVTHAYLYRDGTTLDADDLYPPTYYTGYTNAQNGDDMWDKCFSKHENVLMVLSGHDPWQHIVYRQDKGINGNTVTQMLIDAQYVDLNIGSAAMVAMFYFSADGKTLTVRYYSVEKDCYGSELSNFTINL